MTNADELILMELRYLKIFIVEINNEVVMKYNVLPIPKNLSKKELENRKFRDVFNCAKNDMRETLDKLLKREPGVHFSEVFYLHDEKSMGKLIGELKDGDEIVFHGEGQPFIIGLDEPSSYDLTPYRLATLLKNYNVPDIKININLLACYSATQYQELNFAKDTSTALGVLFNYENLTVTGYTGMIKVASNGKYSVSSQIDKDKRGTHASLAEACIIYKKGLEIKKGRVLTDNSEIAYSWATAYIEAARRGNAIVATVLKSGKEGAAPQLRNSASLTFFPEKDADESESSSLVSAITGSM